MKHIYKDAMVKVLRKQNIIFYLDTRQPLFMFLQLIPMTMLDIGPKNLFDIGEDTWKKYIASRAGQKWIDPDYLPSFDNVTKYVDSTENPMAKTIIQKPHYFMALLESQNKKTITQPYFLDVCNYVYQQDIKFSVTPKKETI